MSALSALAGMSIPERQWRRMWVVVGALAGVGLVLWVLGSLDWSVVDLLQYAVAGLGPGAAAALVGVGLALTYETTGVFNIAFGSMATLGAYVLYALVVTFNVPLAIGVIITVFGLGPFMGIAFERMVFRPLSARAASTSEQLLATIAVFAFLLGLVVAIWGSGAKVGAPQIFGGGALTVGGFSVSTGTIGQVAVIAVCVIGVTALLRYTTLGRQIRAVVDKRALAELVGVRANRVAAIAWAIGTTFAVLAGVLYAGSQGLDPQGLTLIILETFSVVVVARLTNMWLAVVAGLTIGVIQSLLVQVEPTINGWWAGLQNVVPYLFVLALPLFLLIWRDLNELGTASSTGLVSAGVGQRRRRNRTIGPVAIFAVGLVMAGYVAGFNTLSVLQEGAGLAVVFLSIVAITGFSGHITLGQAAFAGTGALLTAAISNGSMPVIPQMNGILAMLLSAVVVTLLGVATGYPALRRKGLILGLATLALNLVMFFMVFNNIYFTNGVTGFIQRPSIFGLSLSGDRPFYFYELVVLAIALLLTGSLRSGRLGRVLAAMRDSEVGATSVGIDMRRYKLFVFAASAFLASIGGSLLVQRSNAFNPNDWIPLVSLFWFLAVVFCGLSYLSGALLAAALVVTLDHAVGQQSGSFIVIGIVTLLTISFLRGGLVGWLLTTARGRMSAGLRSRYAAALAATAEQPRPVGPAPGDGYVLTPFGQDLLSGSGR